MVELPLFIRMTVHVSPTYGSGHSRRGRSMKLNGEPGTPIAPMASRSDSQRPGTRF